MAYKRHGTFSVIGGNGTSPRPKSVSLKEAVERLNTKKRGKGKLTPAATRDKIKESRAEAFPSAPQGGSIASPLTEEPDTRVTEIVRICDPSDATVWVDVEAATQVTFLDANGSEVIMNLVPDTTGNCP